MSGTAHPPGPRSAIVGANVKTQRSRRKMTQEALARASGTTQQVIAKLELGRTNMRVGQLLDIAHGLGVKPATLLRGTDGIDEKGNPRP